MLPTSHQKGNPDLCHRLVQVLDQMVTVLRSWLDLLRQEKAALDEMDFQKIETIMDQKSEVYQKFKNLDRVREQYVTELGRQVGLASDQLQLLRLADHVASPFNQKFREYHGILSVLVERIRHHQTRNMTFIQAHLDWISQAVKQVQTQLGEQVGYNPKGQKESAPPVGVVAQKTT